MGITVRDALKLKGLDKARLVAGKGGLDRRIKRVSVIECPESPELFTEGDFFITAFYAFKNDEKSQLDMVKALVSSNSSGLCVIDMYLKDLSPEIKRYADEVLYPVMILPNDVPYGEIITNVMDAIIQRKDDTIKEMLVDSLLQPGKTENEIISLANQINPDFKERVTAIFYSNPRTDINEDLMLIKNKIKIPPHWSVLKYRRGILFILSFSRETKKSVELYVQEFIKELAGINSCFKLGVSDLHENLSQLGAGIKEALLAADAGEKLNDKNIIFYRDLGLYKLLMLLRNEPELKKFKDEIIGPIADYDEKYHTKLLQTMICYVENDGDLRRTASAMFQHVNTIRYRIEKVKEILHMEHLNNSFYEQLSVAVKIYKLL
ncbi:PucR family transcriptional regulator [Thermoanaerobacterium sp. DL9XJH110]|uniref:PucR family transcriptional regulator n=1 Tax=Thermoanaerobacterium sp. DL9XJH110 TaxID=3386643 RepID=UPI003BB699C9